MIAAWWGRIKYWRDVIWTLRFGHRHAVDLPWWIKNWAIILTVIWEMDSVRSGWYLMAGNFDIVDTILLGLCLAYDIYLPLLLVQVYRR